MRSIPGKDQFPSMQPIVRRLCDGLLHREIIQSIEARNVEGATQAMAEHISVSRDRMLRLFGT